MNCRVHELVKIVQIGGSALESAFVEALCEMGVS